MVVKLVLVIGKAGEQQDHRSRDLQHEVWVMKLPAEKHLLWQDFQEAVRVHQIRRKVFLVQETGQEGDDPDKSGAFQFASFLIGQDRLRVGQRLVPSDVRQVH